MRRVDLSYVEDVDGAREARRRVPEEEEDASEEALLGRLGTDI